MEAGTKWHDKEKRICNVTLYLPFPTGKTLK